MTIYNKEFYEKRHSRTIYAANTILHNIRNFINFESVVDFGCGVGTWLYSAEKLGASETLGFEGKWLDTSLYKASGTIKLLNLSEDINLKHRYDLAISLEVAEHLNESHSESFVNTLCNASDNVLFSAAIRGQGGKGHLNEKMQSYWVELFKKNGYECNDIIRPNIWNDTKIDFWYKQNTFLFTKNKKLNADGLMPIDIVHPEQFLIYRYPGFRLILRNIAFLPKKLLKKLLR